MFEWDKSYIGCALPMHDDRNVLNTIKHTILPASRGYSMCIMCTIHDALTQVNKVNKVL